MDHISRVMGTLIVRDLIRVEGPRLLYTIGTGILEGRNTGSQGQDLPCHQDLVTSLESSR